MSKTYVIKMQPVLIKYIIHFDFLRSLTYKFVCTIRFQSFYNKNNFTIVFNIIKIKHRKK